MPTSILNVVFFTAKIDYYKPVLFLPSRLTQLSQFFISHIASHMIIENVVKILQVLRKQINEIRILSDCLAGSLKYFGLNKNNRHCCVFGLGAPIKKNFKFKDVLADELYKPVTRKFQRRRVHVNGVDEIWVADLIDMQAFSKDNNGIKYLLTVIDVFSKFVWIVPLKRKTGFSIFC